jgi:hypothetical protein
MRGGSHSPQFMTAVCPVRSRPRDERLDEVLNCVHRDSVPTTTASSRPAQRGGRHSTGPGPGSNTEPASSTRWGSPRPDDLSPAGIRSLGRSIAAGTSAATERQRSSFAAAAPGNVPRPDERLPTWSYRPARGVQVQRRARGGDHPQSCGRDRSRWPTVANRSERHLPVGPLRLRPEQVSKGAPPTVLRTWRQRAVPRVSDQGLRASARGVRWGLAAGGGCPAFLVIKPRRHVGLVIARASCEVIASRIELTSPPRTG